MKTKIQIVTPQFKRPDSWIKPKTPPKTFKQWNSLSSLDEESLLILGLGKWGKPEDEDGNEIESAPTLWLFPGEWYSHIPYELKLTDVMFKDFISDSTMDDDIRFGFLAYGILKEN